MNRTSFLLLLSLFSLIASPACAVPSAEIRGLRVVSDGYGDDMQLRPFNWSSGTSISVLVQNPDGGIIALDREQSTMEKFQDDKGSDLTKKEEGGMFSSTGFGMMPGISKDGKAILFEYSAPQVPSAGAKTLAIQGSAILKVATQKERHKQKDLALTIGTVLNAGPLKLKISKVAKPQWSSNNSPLAVTFETTNDISSIESVEFQKADGSPLESSEASTMSMTMNGVKTVQKEYHLAEKVDKVNVTVNRWKDMRSVKVPLQFEAGLGIAR